MTSLKGSCLCGAARYRVHGFILGCHACHCPNCKKFTGSAHSTVMIGLGKNLSWDTDRNSVSFFEEDTPNPRAFCRQCGSPLPSISNNGMVVIPAGTLDTDPEIELSHHIFTKYKACWQPETAERVFEDTLPPDEAIAMWREIGARTEESDEDLVEFMSVCIRSEGFGSWWSTNEQHFDPRLQRLMRRANNTTVSTKN